MFSSRLAIMPKKAAGPRPWYGSLVLVGHPVRPVGGVGRQIEEERGVLLAGFLDPVHGQVEPDVGAIARVPLELAVVTETAVEVVVLPEVGHRGDAPAEVVDRLLKAALMRQVRDSCRPGATCRTSRCDSRRRQRSRPSSGCRGGGTNARRRPSEAPLCKASMPVMSWPRVGVHIGATWKSVSRTL